MSDSTAELLDEEYVKILKDPELNSKVLRVGVMLQEAGLTPTHAIFAIALAHKSAEKSCPCGSADLHRLNSIDQVLRRFIDAYDCAVSKPTAEA